MSDVIKFPHPVEVARFPRGFEREAETAFRWLSGAGLSPEWRHDDGDTLIVVHPDEESAARAILSPDAIRVRREREIAKFVGARRGRHHKGKSIAAFVREHRAEITEHIRAQGVKGPLNDGDREDWVGNDEMLTEWARSEGVDL